MYQWANVILILTTQYRSSSNNFKFSFNTVPSQKSKWSCICVLGVSLLHLSTILIIDSFDVFHFNPSEQGTYTSLIPVIYNNGVIQVICESWQFTQMWKTLTRSHHVTRRSVWTPETSLIPPRCIEVSVQSQESERSCKCVLDVLILPLYLHLFDQILELFR
jgi:hypothetical protein